MRAAARSGPTSTRLTGGRHCTAFMAGWGQSRRSARCCSIRGPSTSHRWERAGSRVERPQGGPAAARSRGQRRPGQPDGITPLTAVRKATGGLRCCSTGANVDQAQEGHRCVASKGHKEVCALLLDRANVDQARQDWCQPLCHGENGHKEIARCCSIAGPASTAQQNGHTAAAVRV